MKHLVLVGMMGAGKTTVGRLCADRLGRPFIDTDDVVESLARASVAEIFANEGEACFRDWERQAIGDVCASPAALVIACGGGAVLDATNRRLLRATGRVVWLRAPAAVLHARVGAGSGRPLLASGARSTLGRLAAQRESAYSAVAHSAVDTEDIGPDSVADAVLALLDEVPE